MAEVKIGTCGIIILALIVVFGLVMLAPTSAMAINLMKGAKPQTA